MSVNLVQGDNELNVQLVPIVANLYGRVTAVDGYALQGVKVEVAGVLVYTDASGNYAITGIPPGSYTITFSKTGYTTLTR